MTLIEKINNDLKAAMRQKDQVALRGIRSIKSAILLAQTEKGGTKELSETQEIQLLQKLVKQRKDSLEIYESQKREDLAQKEREEIEIIQRYLPKQMAEEELENYLSQVIQKTGASSMKDMGKVMGIANKELAGKADGKTIAMKVKQLLTN